MADEQDGVSAPDTAAAAPEARGQGGQFAYIAEQLQHLALPIDTLSPDPANARKHSQRNLDAIKASLQRWGQRAPVVVQKQGMIVRAGNGRLEAAKALGWSHLAAVVVDDSSIEAVAFAIADNRTAELAEWDQEVLAQLLDSLPEDELDSTGFTSEELGSLLDEITPKTEHAGNLAAKFLAPPFSVLNAREGWWQDRKRQWVGLGIRSEVGRGENLAGMAPAQAMQAGKYVHKGEVRGTIGGQGASLAAGLYAKKGADGKLKYTPMKHRAIPGGGTGANSAWKFKQPDGKYSSHEDAQQDGTGTSIFDPVLCELAIRWFSPADATILDPFAGGSVRGVVSSVLGRRYVGVELRAEQVQANREQWATISARKAQAGVPKPVVTDPQALTPVQQIGDWWFKRDDAFEVNGVCGGKVRSCLTLAQKAPAGCTGLVTAGSRASPQVNIVAHVAQALGLSCRAHTPQGSLSPEVEAAQAAGAEIVQHEAGYNTVIVKRAADDAAALGWLEIPFGMECAEAVAHTRRQVANLPAECKRIVVPCGSGMSLAGILWGLLDTGRGDVEVVAVQVGADPAERLDRYGPKQWRDMVQLVPSGTDYHEPAQHCVFAGVQLDPIYEAKCIPHMKPGSLLWVVGIRQTAGAMAGSSTISITGSCPAPVWHEGDSSNIGSICAGVQADMLLTCPPYADLEVYSDHPADISGMEYEDFLKAYRHIIAEACTLLREDSFAVVVVGEVRDGRGHYRNFVGDTVQAFRDAGLQFYNEAILVTPIGSLPLRAGKAFKSGRKLGKTHQNVLVFVKGDFKTATQRCGDVEIELGAEALGDDAEAAG